MDSKSALQSGIPDPSVGAAAASNGKKVKRRKIVVLGDVNVGKTALIHRFCHNGFDSKTKPTVGALDKIKTYYLSESN